MHRLLLACLLFAAPVAVPGALAQSDEDLAAAVVAFLEEEADDATPEERATMAACLTEAVLGLSQAERALLMAPADFEKGLGAVIGQRPEFEDEIEACEG